ncbi:hypothetical protein TRFO_12789 [Tritrichomonas foetus]|uniref:RING-type domain-containing protein n=1 Tax=Tritrichomonas foetus TaxID=1144522 RepID=A0A1J4L4R2_9EUKA|nr:hypothetical protein TRFO_12789 [Tritrichomonas foetus]|eukprot:OHT16917.1 hypothetical protein TRFO_12789 [Tritrichomonas foetus]
MKYGEIFQKDGQIHIKSFFSPVFLYIMGASESADYEVLTTNFLRLSRLVEKTCGVGVNRIITPLKESSKRFFLSYFNAINGGKILEGALDDVMQKVSDTITGFHNCVKFLKTNRRIDFKNNLNNDFFKVCKQFQMLAEATYPILDAIISSPDPSFMTRLDLEFASFNFAFGLKPIEDPPFYKYTTLPIYSLRQKINDEMPVYLNVNTPHSTGKSLGIPLLVACRSLAYRKTKKFIIIIENSPMEIYKIYRVFKNEYSDIIETYTNITEFCKQLNSVKFSQVIGIFTPFDALKVIQLRKEDIFEKARFIIDDFHQRTIESDVLIQILSNGVLKNKTNIKNNEKDFAQITLMSSTPDDRIKNYISKHFKDYSFTDMNLNTFDFDIREVKCQNILDLCDKQILFETKKIIEEWANNDDHLYPMGTIVAYFHNDSIGIKFGQKLVKSYHFTPIKTKRPIFPIKSKMKPNEHVDDFFEKIMNEINTIKIEREADIHGTEPLFFIPLYLTSVLNKKHKEFADATIPEILQKSLIRIVINTSMKNESLINMRDITVVLDSGLCEVEFFDSNLGLSYLKEDILPGVFREQRQLILGRYNIGQYVYFKLNRINPELHGQISLDVKRADMRKSYLKLRHLGIPLENQHNLPNEPNHEILDGCIQYFQRLNVIENKGPNQNDLTVFGREVIIYSDVTPALAASTAKFTCNHLFGFIVSLIIDNCDYLIDDISSLKLIEKFSPESDIVTLFNAVIESLPNIDEMCPENGLNAPAVSKILNCIKNMCNEKYPGRNVLELLNEVKTWAERQTNSVLGAIDSFFATIRSTEPSYLENRSVEFFAIVGAGNQKVRPTLIFNSKIPGVKINLSNRPGWKGLQCPGNAYILSLKIKEKNKEGTLGFLIHHNSTLNNNPGVVSKMIDNPSVNSNFFVSLFEAYWNDQPTINDFVGIYHSFKPNKESAFLIHVTEVNYKNYVNFCPKSKEVENSMNEAIPLILSLMPYVPRSFIIKNDTPLCCAEITSFGNNQYLSYIHLFNDPDSEAPIPYMLNRNILKYAANNRNQLCKNNPLIRFAITGESVIFKFIRNKQVDIELEYPDVRSSLKTVFGNFASHLVLLVDKHHSLPPGEAPMRWMEEGRAALAGDAEDLNIEYMAKIADKIIQGIGYTEKSSNVFFVNLSNGKIKIDEGEIPEKISAKLGKAGDNTIRKGIHGLIKEFTRTFLAKQEISEPIPLTAISSNNACTNYTSHTAKAKISKNICNGLTDSLRANPDDIQVVFLGNSLLCIHMKNPIDNTLIAHKRSADLYNSKYQPCQADTIIRDILTSMGVPVTKVTHCSCLGMRIQHTDKMRISPDEFIHKVTECSTKFGFLQSVIPEYFENFDEENPNVLGYTNVEVYDLLFGIALANELHKTIQADATYNPDLFETMTHHNLLMTTISSRSSLRPKLGGAPRVKPTETAYVVPKGEIQAMKELLAIRARSHTDANRWKFDDRYRVLIIPEKDTEDARNLLRKLKNEEQPIICPSFCDPEAQTLFPTQIYAYERDGSVTAYVVCEDCMKYEFSSKEELVNIMNPNTLMINQDELHHLNQRISGISAVDSTEVKDANEFWPQVPLGQLIWALMSDPEIVGAYIKEWFTIVVDFTIRHSMNLFTFCPNHPNFLLILPKERRNIKCNHCNFMFCSTCRSWHNMDQPCIDEDPSIKRCPRCKLPSFKYAGCDHITCRCGCHWCYRCAKAAFDTPKECYTHMGSCKG